jgi:outer membrane protein, heavy metal efflux system
VVVNLCSHRVFQRAWNAIVLLGLMQTAAAGQTVYTWPQLKDKFEAVNPTLKAAQATIEESRATEITAYLRPNPQLSVSADQFPLVGDATDPFQNLVTVGSFSYLHEREHKRELRRDSARQSTVVAESTYRDQERSLLFNLQNAFVQLLQAKAVLQNATENLAYWDRELAVNRQRFDAGDLAQVDLNRLELQRVQFEADFETATVNVRTSKIQLLMLLNDRTPIDQFDVTGAYDFQELLMPLEQYRTQALATRPDLEAAIQGVELAKTNHELAVANGSADPTLGLDVGHQQTPDNSTPALSTWFGVNVSLPIRVFDRNQGEKARTEIDIRHAEQLRDANQALVFSDVDSAYWTLTQAVNLLRPYTAKYLPLAEDNRNRITIAFQNGGATLLDFLDAEKAYRDTRLAYLTLIGSYLTAAAQMNMAVGMEVLP